MELMTVTHQWANRPADECYENVYALKDMLEKRRAKSREAVRPFTGLKAIPFDNGDVQLLSLGGAGKPDSEREPAVLTHHSFNQLANMAGFSGDFFRGAIENFREVKHAADWVARGINYGLEGRCDRIAASTRACDNARILCQLPNGKPQFVVRGLNTERFTPNENLSDLNIVNKLLIPLAENGFTNPDAYNRHKKNSSDPDVVPAGLYASDRDLFALMAPKNVRRINMPSSWKMPEDKDGGFGGIEIGGQLLYPFVIVTNGEVGGTSATFTTGLLNAICANLILWGARDVVKVSIRHVGEGAGTRLEDDFYEFMRQWITAGTLAEREAITLAMKTNVGIDKNSAIEFLNKNGWSKKMSTEVVELIEQGDKKTGIINDDPTNLWNQIQAITFKANQKPNSDARTEMQEKAGKLMEYAGRAF